MKSNIIQFPISREFVARKARIATDKDLSDLGKMESVYRMYNESDVDYRKRIIKNR